MWTYSHVYERGYRLNLWPHLLNVAIGPPLKYIYIYIYIYIFGWTYSYVYKCGYRHARLLHIIGTILLHPFLLRPKTYLLLPIGRAPLFSFLGPNLLPFFISTGWVFLISMGLAPYYILDLNNCI